MAYATIADVQMFEPSILDNGIADFSNELQLATDDLLDTVKTDWWPQAVTRYIGNIGQSQDVNSVAFPILDIARLDILKLKNATVYLALSLYIMPKLSSRRDADGDAFTRKSEHFTKMFKREWDLLGKRAIYDFNNDGQFTDIERARPARRLIRA